MASLFAKELSSHNIDRKIIAFIVKRISIVHKYTPSIKDILHSANTAAENFNKDNPPLCACDYVKSLGENYGSALGHCWIKGTEISDDNIRAVTIISAKSRPISSNVQTADAIEKSIISLLNLTFNGNLQYSGNLTNIEISQKTEKTEGFFSELDIRNVNKKLSKCVVSFLDKNGDCPIIVCPFLFWLKLYNSFLLDIDHFGKINSLEEKQILRQWIQWYKTELNCTIPLMRENKWSIPKNASILFKNKDTINTSPFFSDIRVRIYIKASYKNKTSPFKKALQVANASLFKAMQIMHHEGLQMKKCQDMVEVVQKKVAKLSQVYGDDTFFEMFQYDIENFFTNVTTDMVQKSLDFFLLQNQSIREGFWVHKKNMKKVFTVKPHLQENFFFLSKHQLFQLVLFEMKNCFFKIGKHMVMKQLKGLSIGGFLSSALAIMLANYAEHLALSEVNSVFYAPSGMRVIDGLRMTDDGLIIIVINRKLHLQNHATYVLNTFVSKFEDNTGNSLNIIFSEPSTLYHIFENSVVNTRRNIIVGFHVKNFESLKNSGTQKIIKGIHPESAVSVMIKINTIMNTLMRIRQGSTFDLLCILASLQYLFEVLHGYKWKKEWVLKGLYTIRNHHSQNEDLWTLLINICNKSSVFTDKCAFLLVIEKFQSQVDKQLTEMNVYTA